MQGLPAQVRPDGASRPPSAASTSVHVSLSGSGHGWLAHASISSQVAAAYSPAVQTVVPDGRRPSSQLNTHSLPCSVSSHSLLVESMPAMSGSSKHLQTKAWVKGKGYSEQLRFRSVISRISVAHDAAGVEVTVGAGRLHAGARVADVAH